MTRNGINNVWQQMNGVSLCRQSPVSQQLDRTINQLIGDFYFSIMDSVKRDADGIKPIQGELDLINAIKNK